MDQSPMDNPYQPPTARIADPVAEVRRKKLGLFGSLFMTCFPALILSIAAPRFGEVFASFGAALPWLSRMVVNGYLAAWLLPILVVAVWLYWPNPKQRGFVVVAISLVSMMLVPFYIIALYLPIFRLGTVV